MQIVNSLTEFRWDPVAELEISRVYATCMTTTTKISGNVAEWLCIAEP